MGILKDMGASYAVLSGGKSEKKAGTLNEHERIITPDVFYIGGIFYNGHFPKSAPLLFFL